MKWFKWFNLKQPGYITLLKTDVANLSRKQNDWYSAMTSINRELDSMKDRISKVDLNVKEVERLFTKGVTNASLDIRAVTEYFDNIKEVIWRIDQKTNQIIELNRHKKGRVK